MIAQGIPLIGLYSVRSVKLLGNALHRQGYSSLFSIYREHFDAHYISSLKSNKYT